MPIANINEGDVLRVSVFGSSNNQAVNNSFWFYIGRINLANPVDPTLIGDMMVAFDAAWADVVALLGSSYETHKAHYDKMSLAVNVPGTPPFKTIVTEREIDLYPAGDTVGGVAGAELPLLATVSGAKQASANLSVTGRFSLSPIPEAHTINAGDGNRLEDLAYDDYKNALDPLIWNGFQVSVPNNAYAIPCVYRKNAAETTGGAGDQLDFAARSFGILLGRYVGTQNTRKIRRSLA